MKKITFLFIFLFFISLTSFSQSIATYNIVFNSVWNASDHGTLPDGPHWSKLVGANHNSSITFLEMGGIATQGIENIAETGSITEFRDNEVNPSITNGTSEQFIEGSGLSGATGDININGLEVSEDFPLLTLVSMIAPSPDWIIAINSLNLRNAGNTGWQSLINIDLYAYDAGTDSGTGYSSGNADISPHIAINNLQGVPPFNNSIIGTFTITLQSVLSTEDIKSINHIKIYPNPTKGAITISNIQNIELSSIKIYNVLGRLVKQIDVKQGLSKLNANLANLNKGIYLLNLKTMDGASRSQKLVIN